jgi:hypothetical protein
VVTPDSTNTNYTNSLVPVTANGPDSAVGGLVGQNDGSIADSYSFAQVSGSGNDNSIGGLIGVNSATGSLATSFSVVPVIGSGTSSVGALVGTNSGTISNAVWDYESTSLTNAVGSGSDSGAIKRTTLEMLDKANYTGWNFDNAWTINTASESGDGSPTGSSFPYLKDQYSYTPTMIIGRVVDGAAGLTVKNYGTSSSIVNTMTTFGADGLYYTVLPQGKKIGNLFVVDGDLDFKANSIYPTGVPSFDLYKDTLYVQEASNGGAGLGDLRYPATVPAGDLLYTIQSNSSSGVNDLTVDGNLKMYNFLWSGSVYNITATGSILLDNTTGHRNYYGTTFLFPDYPTTITAGDDITILVPTSLVLEKTVNGTTQIKAGGDVTIHADNGYFVNWNGADAIQAGGRYLVYAKDLVLTAGDNRRMFYLSKDDQIQAHPNSKYREWGEYWTSTSDEQAMDTRGGLIGDFVVWGGGAAPTDGSGFIYTASNPTFRALTSTQIMRQQAIDVAQADSVLSLSAATNPEENGKLSLTIQDKGVTLPSDANTN